MTDATEQADPHTPPSTTQGTGPRFSYAAAALERSIRRALTAILQEFGLSVAQYTTLSLVRRRAGYSNAQLARRSFVSPQAMHEVISELVARGLLEQTRSSNHRTIRLTYLTAAGRELLDRSDAAVDGMEEVVLAGVPEERREELVTLLMQAARALGQSPPSQ